MWKEKDGIVSHLLVTKYDDAFHWGKFLSLTFFLPTHYPNFLPSVLWILNVNQYGRILLLEIWLWLSLRHCGDLWLRYAFVAQEWLVKWCGIVSSVSWSGADVSLDVLGHRMLYRLIMHNSTGHIFPPNSTDNELFKHHSIKIYNYSSVYDAMGKWTNMSKPTKGAWI